MIGYGKMLGGLSGDKNLRVRVKSAYLSLYLIAHCLPQADTADETWEILRDETLAFAGLPAGISLGTFVSYSNRQANRI